MSLLASRWAAWRFRCPDVEDNGRRLAERDAGDRLSDIRQSQRLLAAARLRECLAERAIGTIVTGLLDGGVPRVVVLAGLSTAMRVVATASMVWCERTRPHHCFAGLITDGVMTARALDGNVQSHTSGRNHQVEYGDDGGKEPCDQN